MSQVPASVRAPRYPQVNLIPPEVGMRRVRGRQRAIATVFLIVFVLALGGAGYLVHGLKVEAERELAVAQKRNASLQEEAGSYALVPVINDILTNIVSARAYAGASEVNFNDFIARFDDAVPEGITIDTFVLNKVGLTANAAEATGPFARSDIGQLSFSGSSMFPIDSATLADAIEQVVGLERVRVSATVREVLSTEEDGDDGEIRYVFSATARVTIEALSGRFAPVGESPSDTEEGSS